VLQHRDSLEGDALKAEVQALSILLALSLMAPPVLSAGSYSGSWIRGRQKISTVPQQSNASAAFRRRIPGRQQELKGTWIRNDKHAGGRRHRNRLVDATRIVFPSRFRPADEESLEVRIVIEEDRRSAEENLAPGRDKAVPPPHMVPADDVYSDASVKGSVPGDGGKRIMLIRGTRVSTAALPPGTSGQHEEVF
jgi:hypothetical protein